MFELIPAPDAELIKQTRILNSVSWGLPILNTDDYLLREEAMGLTSFSRNRLETWIYIDTENPGDILSACESYSSPCIAFVNGRIIKGNCPVIASVFTTERHRKNGYASAMLKALQKVFRKRKDVVGSTLYSDIGPKFYHNMGWKYVESKVLSIPLDQTLGFDHSPEVKLLALKELEPHYTGMEGKIEEELIREGVNAFCLTPCYDKLFWFHARASFYCKHFHPTREIQFSGAECANGDFVAWFHDFKDSHLVILYMQVTNEQNRELLYKEAFLEAKKWSLKTLDSWGPTQVELDFVKSLFANVEYEEREESLSSLCFWGEFGNEKDYDLEWVKNYKYAWC